MEPAHALLIECVTKLGTPDHCTSRLLDDEGIDNRTLGPEIFDRARMKETVAGALERGIERIIVDMSETVWITSEGLSQFIALRELVHSHSGRLVLANLNKRVQRVFDISGLSEVFEIASTVSEALSMIEEPS